MSLYSISVLHNIPSPYRVHLFNCLASEFRKVNCKLHVHFFGTNNPDRPTSWPVALEGAGFDYTVWSGIRIPVFGQYFWFNPTLIYSMIRSRHDVLIHGGIWDSFTSLIVFLFGRPKIRVGWLELNASIAGRSGLFRTVKRLLLNRCSRLLVPGQSSRQYISEYAGDDLMSRVTLMPNIVDETLFARPTISTNTEQVRDAMKLSDVRKGDLVLLLPARLIPAKGILEFFDCIDAYVLDGLAIRIVGSGPMRPLIQNKIESAGLKHKVQIVDERFGYESMPSVYHCADGLLLPSIRDPNPLSVVEALHAGLPLIISNRVGNFPEALVEGKNGFGFDPMNGNSVREAVKKFKNLTKAERKAFGAVSIDIGKKQWDSSACIEHVVGELFRQLKNDSMPPIGK